MRPCLTPTRPKIRTVGCKNLSQLEFLLESILVTALLEKRMERKQIKTNLMKKQKLDYRAKLES